ncbi:MAG: hypothetical protein SWH61_10940 [Thermodesulfobacteriota bacterium]|nr:hypothetical protein [Thermodesulfobacteriota bacterium]
MGTVIVVLLSMAVAGCFFFFYLKEKMKNDTVRQSLTDARKEIRTLVDKNDMLMARLVAMEVEAEETGDAVFEAEPDPMLPERSATEASQAIPPDAAEEDEPTPLVDVKSFAVIQDKGSNRVKIEFTVEKVDESREYVSGRVFVVLQDEDAEDGRMMTVPAVYMKDGRPTQISRGQYFSIARFKPVIMSTRIDHPEIFTTAMVFIYTPEGELFFKDSFAVNPIQYRQFPPIQNNTTDSQAETEAPADIDSTVQ